MSPQPPSSTQQLPAWLTDNAELDAATGLKHVQHNVENYMKLLALFSRLNRDEGSRLCSFIRAGDSQNARLIAHKLKGSSATLGAVKIQALATSIDLKIKQTGSCQASEDEAEQLVEAISRLTQTLQPLLSSEDS